MRCTFQPITEPDDRGWRKWKCSRPKCGLETSPTPHKADRIFATCRVRGLGDYLTFYLSLLGITKQRIEWITRKPCGCEERATRLNTLGERLAAWWRAEG